MPDRKTLEALLVRVEGAGGEARELDLAMHRALEPEQYPDRWRWIWDDDRPPHLTSSIDAALALVGRLLPKWSIRLSLSEGYKHPNVGMARSYPTNAAVTVEARTAPLAILAALLTALMQTQDENV